MTIRRPPRTSLAVALVAGGALLAGVPFTGRLPFDGPVWNDEPTAEQRPVRGRCRPPILSAWRKPARDEPVWVVTVQTNMEGDRLTDLGRWCATGARRRLLASAGVIVADVITAWSGGHAEAPEMV